MAYQVLTNIPPLPKVREAAGDLIDFYVWDPDDAEVVARLPEIEGVFLYGLLPIDGAFMDRMPKLKVICTTSVGVDHINLDDARARGIPVGNVPGILDGAVADLAFAILLAYARNIVTAVNYAHSPEFTVYDPTGFMGHEVHSTTLGIMGLGNIGKAIAKRALAFDMNILYHNRHRDLEAEKTYHAEYCSMPDLFGRADYVLLMVPLTQETYHMIGAEQLHWLKPTGVLINMARGGVVDHDALVTALQEKWFRGAVLDVTEPEPLPRDHPLLSMDNVLMSPHLGSSTIETREAMMVASVENLLAGLRGQPLPMRKA